MVQFCPEQPPPKEGVKIDRPPISPEYGIEHNPVTPAGPVSTESGKTEKDTPMIGGFGGASVDRIFQISHWPEPDRTCYIRSRLTAPGGMTLNALIAAARMGAPASYLGALGNDEDGAFLESCLRDERIITKFCRRIPEGTTPASQIMTDPENRRTIFHDRGIRDCDYRKELSPPRLEGIDVLLLDGSWICNTLEWAEEAVRRKIPVVLDLSPNNIHPLRDSLLTLADYPVISRELASRITLSDRTEDQPRMLRERFGGTVIVTCGSEGVWWAGEKGTFHIPAFSVKTVDTTGAGDTFHGALAAAVFFRLPLEEAIKTAMAAAALKCTRRGHEGLPDRETLHDFLRTGRSPGI